jgi:hypothetical protein
MTVKGLIRPLPGVRTLSLARQRMNFKSSREFWENKYTRGGTSGDGSYGSLGQVKADIVNAFVRQRHVESIIEFGCGDGHQLSLGVYPRYVGLDVSKAAIDICIGKFAGDSTKSFFLYDGERFVDHAHLLTSDLAMSLDVVYHLIEDSVYERYMAHLFSAGQRYVIIYSTNADLSSVSPQVRHRRFATWVEANCPRWRLTDVVQGPNTGPGRADFYVYERG